MKLDFDLEESKKIPREETTRKKVADGTYKVVITKSKEWKTDKEVAVIYSYQVLDDGKWKNWFVDDWITLVSEKPAKVGMGRQKLEQLAECHGVKKIGDSSEIINRTMFITLVTRGQYQNITKYEPATRPAAPPATNFAATTFDDDEIPF